MVSWVALGVVWALSIGPAWLIGRVARREPLRPKGGTLGIGWSERSEQAPLVNAMFADEEALGSNATPRFGWISAVPRFVGWMMILVLVNYGAGWAYDELAGTRDTPDGTSLSIGDDPTFVAATPALVDESWALGHLEELADLEYEYEPYVLTRVLDADGPTVTVEDGVRRSYEPTAAGGPEVWFFGGGTAFGQGQRDEETIPSVFARAAEDAGAPVRVVNLAQPGHTTWQQWQLFERTLAVRPAPDVAVFLGGYDDVRVQLELTTPDPTHYNVVGADRALERDAPPTDLGELVDEYQDVSVLNRLVRNVRGLVGTAHAGGVEDRGPAGNAVGVRDRARLFLDHLGSEHDVEIVT
ncbi:MAG: hypothetical protein AAGK32_15960, partial [Actinomycetota bacterium]